MSRKALFSLRLALAVAFVIASVLVLVHPAIAHGLALAAVTAPLISEAGGRPILSPDYLQQHQVGTSGQDVIWNPLFDSLAYPSAGGTSFNFFSQPIGQGTTSEPGAGAGSKTKYDTNMDLSGILGAGNDFYQIGMEFLFLPGVQNTANTPFALFPGRSNTPATVGSFVNDVWAVTNGGYVTEKVGTNREYISDGPLSLFPPATRLAVAAAIAEIGPSSTSTGVGTEIAYAVASGEPYVIVPVYIQNLQKFSVVLEYAAAIVTPSQTIGRLIARMRGYLIRQVT